MDAAARAAILAALERWLKKGDRSLMLVAEHGSKRREIGVGPAHYIAR
jgi:hypothetical protein